MLCLKSNKTLRLLRHRCSSAHPLMHKSPPMILPNRKNLGNFVGQGAIISAHKLSRRKITGGGVYRRLSRPGSSAQ
jgi:hypothetical protein